MATAVGSSASFTPSASTAAEMVRSVLDYVQGADDNELRDVALRELNFAIDEANARTWRKAITTQTITLVAGTDTYTLNDNFKDPIRAILLLNGDRKDRLFFEEMITFLARFPDRLGTAAPGLYTIDYSNRLFMLEGQPNASFLLNYDSVELHYYLRFAHLAQDSDVHGGPPEFNAFFVWQARAGVAAIRGDQRLAGYAEGKAKAIYRELRVSDA